MAALDEFRSWIGNILAQISGPSPLRTSPSTDVSRGVVEPFGFPDRPCHLDEPDLRQHPASSRRLPIVRPRGCTMAG